MKQMILLIAIAFSLSINAQTDSAKVDVQQLVKDQIELAKAKEEYKNLTTATEDVKEAETAEQKANNEEENADDGKIGKDDILKMLAEEANESRTEASLGETEETASAPTEFVERKPYVVKRIPLNRSENKIGWKLLLLTFAAVAAAGFVLVRRRIARRTNNNDTSLKKNIKLIREEKVIRKDLNPYLHQIRKQLKDSAGRGSIDDKVVTETARKLRISREEILLANRIHNHEMKNV